MDGDTHLLDMTESVYVHRLDMNQAFRCTPADHESGSHIGRNLYRKCCNSER